LRKGVLKNEVHDTCSAGAGTLLLEFGVLSRLTGLDVYEVVILR
jgi:mannosidase alpha-like ER degradation enhancer 1